MKKMYAKMSVIVPLLFLGACKSGNQDKISNQSVKQSGTFDTVRVVSETLVGQYEICVYVDKNGNLEKGIRNLLVQTMTGDTLHIKPQDTIVVDNSGVIVNHFVKHRGTER